MGLYCNLSVLDYDCFLSGPITDLDISVDAVFDNRFVDWYKRWDIQDAMEYKTEKTGDGEGGGLFVLNRKDLDFMEEYFNNFDYSTLSNDGMNPKPLIRRLEMAEELELTEENIAGIKSMLADIESLKYTPEEQAETKQRDLAAVKKAKEIYEQGKNAVVYLVSP